MLVKIRMKTLMAGPKGVRNTGEIVEVPKPEADALCPVYAELLEPVAIVPPKTESPPEPKPAPKPAQQAPRPPQKSSTTAKKR
jgi:hypothetical protein